MRLLSCATAATLLALTLPAWSQDALIGDWRVDRIDGNAPVAGSKVMMRFDAKGRVSGAASCNRFGAAFSVEGAQLRIGPAMSTRMACRPDLMAQEQRFLRLLEGALSWRVEAGRLTLSSSDGAIEAAAVKP